MSQPEPDPWFPPPGRNHRGKRSRLGAMPTDARVHNRSLLFRNIWAHPGVSRAELARLTKVSAPVAGRIVGELQAAGLVREEGSRRVTGGRPGAALYIEERSRYIVAVDLARHTTRIAVMDLSPQPIAKQSFATTRASDPADNARELCSAISTVIESSGVARESLLGIGIGSPGPLRADTGKVLACTNFDEWHGVELRTVVEKKFGLLTLVDNDANVCALAQSVLGEGRGLDDFVYLAAGSGIGAGVVINGVIHVGNNGFAGEIGHLTIDLDGPPCPCGNVGCLEQYATLAATIRRYSDQPITDEDTAFDQMIQAAEQGDDRARKAIETSGRYLGVTVNNIINTYDPQAVIVGRELARAGALLFDPMHDVIRERAFRRTDRRVKIIEDKFNSSTPLLGAASLILERFLSDGEFLAREAKA
jgi:predicted NBD/HSP70 family sugar kinase